MALAISSACSLDIVTPSDIQRLKASNVLLDMYSRMVETLKVWHDAGYLLIVVTNQGGLAKGLYEEADVHAMHQYFQGLCVQAGFSIAHFYFCPHHPDFNGRCLCRKPGSLMIEKGLHQFRLDPEQCLIIGDKQRDLDAAAAAGVDGVLIDTNARIPLPEEIL